MGLKGLNYSNLLEIVLNSIIIDYFLTAPMLGAMLDVVILNKFDVNEANTPLKTSELT